MTLDVSETGFIRCPKAKKTKDEKAMSDQRGLVLKAVTEKFAKAVGNRNTSALRYFLEYTEIVTTSRQIGGNVDWFGRGSRGVGVISVIPWLARHDRLVKNTTADAQTS